MITFKPGLYAVAMVALMTALGPAGDAFADDRYLGQIRMFAGVHCPPGSTSTEGQIISVNQNTPLYSLLGSNFGGDGRRSMGLPDLRGRAPMGTGKGYGLTYRARRGQKLGSDGAYGSGSGATQFEVAQNDDTDHIVFPTPIILEPPAQVITFCVTMQGLFPSRY